MAENPLQIEWKSLLKSPEIGAQPRLVDRTSQVVITIMTLPAFGQVVGVLVVGVSFSKGFTTIHTRAEQQ